ncbi:H-type small acid-soluble spore protein [Paenibacillus xanthanilyticus]|uniref:H-type small acid-soluble spore protein n=1 Tax=Paenibacillus xanthanilyticus TaxID=1783531 RepID=A0ABV8K482_9BACL
MNTERAKQILAAKETIPVLFEGKPIWIEKVDETFGTATIEIEASPRQVETVSVEKLIEA